MTAPLTPRNLFALAAIAAAVALTSACGGGSNAQAATKQSPVTKYADTFISFKHPTAWKTYSFQQPLEMHFFPFVYLSTQAMHNPCSTQGNETTCGWPLAHLEPGGVLAVWQIPYVLPGTSHPTGMRISVGGKPAWRRVTAGGECRAIGADRTIDVMVGQAREFTACLRGPNLARSQRAVNALLASTRFPLS
jgi:hypothetical protein